MAAASPKKDTFVVELDRTPPKGKETKGAVMFGLEDDGRQPVTNLYFKKFGLEKIGEANVIRVTIEKIS